MKETTFTMSSEVQGSRRATPSISGHKAKEILPDLDVAEIASSVFDFLSATRRLMSKPIAELKISQSEIEVLQFIGQHPGCGVSEIARLRFLRASNVSATVRRMINEGYVERQANDYDRRAQDLYLSDSGVELMNKITDHWAVFILQAAERMPREDIRRLRDGVPALRSLSDGAEALIESLQREREKMI